MKRTLISIIFIIVSSTSLLFAGNIDDDLIKIDSHAEVNYAQWKLRVIKDYQIDSLKLDQMRDNIGMTGGDIIMATILEKVSNHPIEKILKLYVFHRNKGWAKVVDKLGISLDSHEFVVILRNVNRTARWMDHCGNGKVN